MEGEKNQEFFPENGKKNCEQRATECIKKWLKKFSSFFGE